MLAKMKETQFGSPNGITRIKYEKGQTYDLPESLFNVFVKQMKIAESKIEEEEKVVTVPENKTLKAEKEEKDKKKDKDKDKK